MLSDKLTLQNDIIGAKMHASNIKNEVITNNIANVDVPGYKKKTVAFDELLSKELNSYKQTGKVDLENIKPQIKTMHSSFNYRIDENNVDIETEMVDLYKNGMEYETMASSIINNYKRINMVVSSR